MTRSRGEKKLLPTLEINYRRSPNYFQAMAVLEPLIAHPESMTVNRHLEIALRPLAPEDSAQLHCWINDRELVELSAPYRPVPRDDHEKWFNDVRRRTDLRIFAIADRETQLTIGYCQLKKIDLQSRYAELQIRIGSRYHHGRGAGEQAVGELLRYAFCDLWLHRVYLHVFESNRRARQCYLKCGFRVEGLLRDAVRIGERYENIVIMGILRHEFESRFRIGSEKPEAGVAPVVDWSSFTEDAYGELLCLAKSRYAFCTYSEALQHNGPHVIWRHDIDMSIHRAMRLAQIEREQGIKATYFFLLRSPFYNLLEPEVLRCARKIVALGHPVGLHFDASAYDGNGAQALDQGLRSERALLENTLKSQVVAVSFHNPDVTGMLDHDSLELYGIANVYAREFRERYKYCSDSNGYWRFEPLQEVLRAGSYGRIHALIHPEWWTPTAMSPRERVERCVLGRAAAVMRQYDACLRQGARLNIGPDFIR